MSGKDPSVLLLEHHLKALKLPTVLRDYASLAAVCSQDRSSYPQYLLRLVERELIDRERRATERRIKEATFPVLKTIESFDFKVQPRPSRFGLSIYNYQGADSPNRSTQQQFSSAP